MLYFKYTKKTDVEHVMNAEDKTNEKPFDSFKVIFGLLSREATTKIVRENRIVYYNKNNMSDCYLLTDGEVTIKSLVGNKTLGNAKAPFLLGFSVDQNNYLQTISESTFKVISTKRTSEIIRENNLWEHFYYISRWESILAYKKLCAINHSSSREIILSLLRNFLQQDPEVRLTIPVVRYLQDNSSLSRSSIYNIISSLKENGSIVVRNGVLIRINNP